MEAYDKLVASFGDEDENDENIEDEVSKDSQEEKREELLSDKDALTTKLEQTSDFMQKELNEVEKACMGTIDREVKEKIKEIEDKQHDRNRKIVKEIIDTCNTFRQEIEEEVAQLRGENEDEG